MSIHGHYLETPEGQLAQYRHRARRRMWFTIEGIEPRAKSSMPDDHKDAIQRQLLDSLVARRRRAFRGPLALRLTIHTTDKNPAHSHNIAKNLLDLFGRPRRILRTRRCALLYSDDNQVHALSVRCRHGETMPRIATEAIPLGGLIKDLQLIQGARANDSADRFDTDAIDRVTDLRQDEAQIRSKFSDAAYESLLWMAQRDAQEQLLGLKMLKPHDLAWMYQAQGHEIAAMWERIFFAESPLRITLSELPQEQGASTLWKQEIEEKLREFQAKWGRIVDPLLVPTALEVVIKPPPPSRERNLHDLDNVLRNYLIPRVVEILNPVSHFAFTFGESTMGQVAPALLANPRYSRRKANRSMPPASSRSGITRYEVWRLPPAEEGGVGVVSLAVVADMTGLVDTFRQIDDGVECWCESLI